MTTFTETKLHDAFGTGHAWGTHQLILHESVTRPHADGVVTNNNDPDSMAIAPADGTDGTGGGNGVAILAVGGDTKLMADRHDDINGSANNAVGTHSGGEAITADFSSYVTNGTTGTVSDSGNDTRLADVTDGTSNTVMFGMTDGSAASNVVESMAVKYTMFDEDGDGLLLGNGAGRLARVGDLGMHDLQIDGAVLDVGDLFVDLGADDRVSGDSGPYTLADGIEGDVSKNAANGPAGKENLNGDIENIDPFVGMVVLDVGDVLSGVDAAADDGTDRLQTRTAGGSTTLQADPDGQANGIIAVLIGVSTDIQGPLD